MATLLLLSAAVRRGVKLLSLILASRSAPAFTSSSTTGPELDYSSPGGKLGQVGIRGEAGELEQNYTIVPVLITMPGNKVTLELTKVPRVQGTTVVQELMPLC